MKHPLVQWRMDNKQTQRSAARAMDVSVNTWKGYEWGVTINLNSERMARLTALTGVTRAQLEKARDQVQRALLRTL